MSYKLPHTAHRIPHTALCLLFSVFCFLLSLNCSAQSKFGHVNYSSIIKDMPGIDSIQTILFNFQNELQSIGEEMSKEFKEKQSALEKLTNTPNTSQAILKIRQEELLAMYKRIQEFANSMETDIRDKKIELLEPFQTKLMDAIKKIAKINHYNYVFDVSTLIFYATSDDLTDKVKAELGMK